MFRAPINNLIISIDSKYTTNLNNAIKRTAIHPGTRVNPADFVNVIGTIESIPLEISNKRGYEGFSLHDIRVGDKALFRFDVIWSFVELENGLQNFKNVIFWEGHDWWKADIQQVFAIIRNNSIKMINGYVMVEKIATKPKIVTLHYNKKEIQVTSATLTQIGNNLTTHKRIDAFPGDRVYFNPTKLQEYEIKGKKFGILTQNQILGKQVGGYGDFAPIESALIN